MAPPVTPGVEGEEAAARRAVLARAVAARPGADPRALRAVLTSLGHDVDGATLAADLDALGLGLEVGADGRVAVAPHPPPPTTWRSAVLTALLAAVVLGAVALLGIWLLDGETDVGPGSGTLPAAVGAGP